ncbi:hypothetical protein AB0O47_40290, partial [Streptomyces noursei]
DGRPDLPGPLCHGVIDKAGEVVIGETEETPRGLIALAAGAINDLLNDQKTPGRLPPREASERVLELLHAYIDDEPNTKQRN